DRSPSQHLRSEHNPEHDLEHDRRQPDPREESEGERSRQRRRRDDSQSTERDRGHRARSVTSRRRSTSSDNQTAAERTVAVLRVADLRRSYWEYPSVTSALCAANAARAAPFS